MGDNGKYPHQEFKVQASDDKGHVERVMVRMPPQMMSKLQKVVNSRQWPYENYQEVVRHAVLRQLAWLEKDTPQIGNLSSQIKSMNLMMDEELQYQGMEHTYEKMRAVFRKNMAVGGSQGANRNLKLVSDMWRKICEIDDPYWREIWKGKFQKEYDTVLQAVPNVGFVEFGEGDEEWEE